MKMLKILLFPPAFMNINSLFFYQKTAFLLPCKVNVPFSHINYTNNSFSFPPKHLCTAIYFHQTKNHSFPTCEWFYKLSIIRILKKTNLFIFSHELFENQFCSLLLASRTFWRFWFRFLRFFRFTLVTVGFLVIIYMVDGFLIVIFLTTEFLMIIIMGAGFLVVVSVGAGFLVVVFVVAGFLVIVFMFGFFMMWFQISYTSYLLHSIQD